MRTYFQLTASEMRVGAGALKFGLLLLGPLSCGCTAASSPRAQYRALEEHPAECTVNCQGCFNISSGECTVDVGDGRSCSNATRPDCEATGEKFVDANPNDWPKGGCLVQVAAKCLKDLEPYECGSREEKYTLHANTTEQCLQDAKSMGAAVRLLFLIIILFVYARVCSDV